MEELQDDLWLAHSVQRHGLNNWKMVANELSNVVLHRRGDILDLSPQQCQVKYHELRGRFMSLYGVEEDDENVVIKLMADSLRKTYEAALKEDIKLRQASIQRKQLCLYKSEAEERIKSRDEGCDRSSKRKSSIDEDFENILDILRSHKHISLFESRLQSQGDEEYSKQIREHMDLEVIEKKVEEGAYKNNMKSYFFRDLLLMFTNAMVYYPKETLQHSAALELRDILVTEMDKLPPTILANAKKTPIRPQKIKVQQNDSTSVRRSERLRSRRQEMKNDP